MKTILRLLALVSIATSLWAQQEMHGFTSVAGAPTIPFNSGASLPGVCKLGEYFYLTTATAGLNTYACTATNTWTLEGDGGGGGGASGPPFTFTKTSSTVMTIGPCSGGTPCYARIGSTTYNYVNSPAVTASSGSSLAYVYISGGSGGTSAGILTVGNGLGGTGLACATGCTVTATVITQFPADSIPLETWNVTTGTWDAAGTPFQAILSGPPSFTAGAGITLVQSNNNLNVAVTGGGGGTVNAGTINQTAYYAAAGTAVSGGGPGTAGQCWTSNGAGSAPTFQACAGGGGSAGPPFTFTRTSATVLTIGLAANPSYGRIGSNTYTYVNSPTVTASSGSSLAYIYVSGGSGGTAAGVLTVGNGLGGTGLVCATGCTVTATTITQFPVDSIPLETWNVTTGTWDATLTAAYQALLSAPPQFIQGAGVTLTQTANTLTIAATGGGGGGFDPMDMTTTVDWYRWATGIASNTGTAWAFSALNCGGATANSAVAAGETYGVNWNGPGCFVSWPNNNGNPGGGFPIKDFISGGSPKNYTLTTRFIKGASAGNYFIGASDGTVTTSNFVGIRYNSGTNKWQCVIVGGGVDVSATNSAATPDTAIHTFSITNGGTANSATCSIDGTSWTAAAGTIPAFDPYFVMGTPTAANAFTTIEARIKISGISR